MTVTITGLDGEPYRSSELHPGFPQPQWLTYVVDLPPQTYRVELEYHERPIGYVDKNHEGGWTTVGTQHQIRLDGGNHYFPPPDHEAE